MEKRENILRKLSTISTSPGVYIMKNASGEFIYVGKAKNLKNRVSTYFNASKKHIKVEAMVNSVFDFDYIVCQTEYDALALENNLIKKHQPHYNILLKDSKTYPYIKINLNEPYPKLELVRKVSHDGAKYFGPYIGKFRAKELIAILNSAFMLKECNVNLSCDKVFKPCIRYHIGQCLAPCAYKEVKDNYLENVQRAIKFLNGDDSEVLNLLSQQMQKMAQNENFEKAIYYRNQIELIKSMHDKLITELNDDKNIDFFAYSCNASYVSIAHCVVRGGKVVGVQNTIIDNLEQTFFADYIVQYYQTNAIPKEICLMEDIAPHYKEYLAQLQSRALNITVAQKGIKKKLLDMTRQNAEQSFIKQANKAELEYKRTLGAVYNLQAILNLNAPPLRIECYDISHISGTYKVASMVVFLDGKPAPSHYRKFKIKTVEGNNDFESLKEALSRRLTNLNDPEEKDISLSSVPNLIIIDGGKGQLSSVNQVFKEHVTARTQNIHLISLAKREEEVFTLDSANSIIIDKHKIELQLLQRIRDEAHRFAITFHRSLRGKGMIKSVLDDIKGIGSVKKKALLKHFSTFEQLEKASIEDLMQVSGINLSLAQNIFNALHK